MSFNSSYTGQQTEDFLSQVDFMSGYNEVTTLSSLPVSKRLIKATVSAASEISVQDGLLVGQEIYISVSPTASFTQNIPTTGSYRSMVGSSIDIESDTPYEISILKIAESGVMYSIIAKVSE